MYIYRGVLDYLPYAAKATFCLVVEDGGFRLGTGIRAFWKWTSNPGSDEAANYLSCGTIDRVELREKPSMSSVFGIFYDLDYPFDIIVGDDLEQLRLMMYQFPKSRSDCHCVANFTVRRIYCARTVVPSYDASRELPMIRYYSISNWRGYLFGIIVPDIIATGRPIWVATEDDEHWYHTGTTMTVVSEDTDKFIVGLNICHRYAKLELWKNSDQWAWIEWKDEQGASTTSSNILATADVAAPGRAPLSASAKSPDVHLILPSQDARLHSLRPIPVAMDNNRVSQLTSASPADEDANLLVLEKASTIHNDTKDAVFCTLAASGNSTKGKVLATIGAGLSVLGMIPLGVFAMPVAAIGVLLAGVGVVDAYNDADADLKTMLFPNERMTRVSSGGLLGTNNNDVLFMYVKIERDVLYLRAGYKEKIGEGLFRLSALRSEDGVVSTIFQIGWTELAGQYIEACKLVKLPQLVPLYAKSSDIPTLSKEVSYANISDGQIILDQAGEEAIYDTLNSSPRDNEDLFTWRDGEVNSVVLHAYRPGVKRRHEVIRVPGSRVFVLRLTGCWIDVDSEFKRSSMSGPSMDQPSVLKLMGRRFAGYAAYSWSHRNSPFAFTKENLLGAKVKYNHKEDSYVYIVCSGYMPWQRVAKDKP